MTVLSCSNCVSVTYPMPAVANGVLVDCVPKPGNCFPLGINPVTCTASNECGRSECTFKIEVRPVPPPSIQCPTNPIVVTAPCGSNCVPVFYPPPVVVGGTLVGCNPPSGSCLAPGVYGVTCLATNRCGDRDVCTFDVRVIPGTGALPGIQCPADMTFFTCSNCVPVTYPAPVVVNGVLVGCFPPPGTCFPIGVTSVSCIASNPCGQVECKFDIAVRKMPPPSILCPTNPIVVTAPCGSNCVPVFYPPPPVVDGTLVGCNPPSGTCLPPGVHPVTCLATNRCGDRDVCTFEVRVIPGTGALPGIQCPADMTFFTCSNCIPVTYPAPVVVNGVLVGCFPPPGTCFPIGVTSVSCIASNPCGQIECTFNIAVHKAPPPSITCPSNIVLTVPCHSNCVPVFYPLPTVVGGTLVGCNPPAGICRPPGIYPVTCVATNRCGERDECTFVVEVRGGQSGPPEIRCPEDITVTTCKNCEVVNYPPPAVNNGVLIGCTPPSGSCLPPGNHVVTCTASNGCERTECRFVIVVRPIQTCIKPPLNMVLWLPFDEPIGPIANNIIAGAPDGTHVGGPVPLLGQYVLNSLSFNGANQWVSVPPYAAITLAESDLSIDAWILRQDDGGRRAIVSKVHPNPNGNVRGYEFYLLDGIMRLGLWGVVQQQFDSGAVVPNDNAWHHVAVTVSRPGSGNVRFYLDGVAVASLPGPIPMPLGNSGRLAVGRTTAAFPALGPAFFRGAIDEVEIFNRALTAAEVHGLWAADRSGKCKIRCSIPWDVSFPPGQPCITVLARICNDTAVPQTVSWSASGPMPFPDPSGTLVLPPFSCMNVPVQICRPTNEVPAGTVVRWELAVQLEERCPIVCMGSVINPGPIVLRVPALPVPIPGTGRSGVVRFSIDGLPPGQPIILRVAGPDMSLDMTTVSLNGLPPGVPLLIGPNQAFTPAAEESHDVQVRFAEADPVGTYSILILTDTNGDETPETVGSIDVENPVVSLPTLRLVPHDKQYEVQWEDEGDGLGVLETSKEVDGPWEAIPGARPGYLVDPNAAKQFFRVVVP
jgi:hypothetical protein